MGRVFTPASVDALQPLADILDFSATPRAAVAFSTPQREMIVYFIRIGEFVKIGTTREISTRLSNIRMCSPHDVELLAVEIGGLAREAELQSRFADLHHRGEWFRYEGDLMSYVIGLRHGR